MRPGTISSSQDTLSLGPSDANFGLSAFCIRSVREARNYVSSVTIPEEEKTQMEVTQEPQVSSDVRSAIVGWTRELFHSQLQ